MLFARLPDPSDPDSARSYPWGRETIVVHDRATRAVYGRHTAPLSLKAVLRGEERYNVHGFFETVGPGEALIVNADQDYESAIEADAPVETLCVFFSSAERLEGERVALTDEALLDDPQAHVPAVEFAAVKRALTPGLSGAIAALPMLRHAPLLMRQEHAARLVLAMLQAELTHGRMAQRVDAVRSSTRAELARRCAIGRAYIDACYADELSLPQLAQAAGLSRTHFLRAYKRCFDETPAQTLRRRRLDRAAGLLASGASVTETALAVGYGDFSAFARAFRRRHGVAPSAFAR